MRILHLAYEDPAQPGSGGGSVRTREVDRRLAERHEVTALVAAYPGARERTEDGIRWIPVGPGGAGRLSRLAYLAMVGATARRFPADVIVEDFGAPVSVALTPLFTRRPLVASVQWLFAREMRTKYHLPFDLVESAGLRVYHDFIAVSDWLAADIRRRRPSARVETIPNGVEAAAFEAAARRPGHLLFLGRLDRAQKGVDLLPAVVAALAERLGSRMPPVLVAGDGPDRDQLEREVAARSLGGVVRLVGRVEGRAKYDLLAGAHALLMPSRFETFGMVAVEAMAAGAPVVAFDVGPLSDVAGPGGARLVRPFDTDAMATAAAALVQDQPARDAAVTSGRAWARRYDWDLVAAAVERHLEDAVAAAATRRATVARSAR